MSRITEAANADQADNDLRKHIAELETERDALAQKVSDAEWVFTEYDAPDAPFLWHSTDGWRCSTYALAGNSAPDVLKTPWDAIRSARERSE